MTSIWTQTARMPQFQPLKENIHVDVLIIGGGMSGILCAYMLEKEGINYALVEADRIGGGITKDTTAKITFQHRLIYHKLIRKFGMEKARMYLEANREALEEYRRLCNTIRCDYEEKNAYVYSRNERKKLEMELEALEKLGYEAALIEEVALPFKVAGAIRYQRQAEFHPLKFISELSKGLNIYEKTCVREIEPHVAKTDGGDIRAEKMIVATHFPFINKHGSYFLKMYQERSYMIALKEAQDVNGLYIDEEKRGLSFRNVNNLLLIGGGGHRTGKQGGNWRELEQFIKTHYPVAKEEARWATQDCMTLDGVPYIGQYSKRTPDFYVATGFNKWGMTGAMAAARILTDQITGKENPNALLFSPSRHMFHPQLAQNILEAAVHFCTITPKRCPHLGCALKWNPQEHTWDCPCHGSRFTKEGKRIDNPATGDLKK